MGIDRIDIENLAILTIEKKRGRLQVTEYVDFTTGEVISANFARRLGVTEVRSEARIRREQKLNSLRKEVKTFALFLLKFRNRRGGFLVTMEELVKWYAKLYQKESKHVRRYLPRLVDAGIIDFDYTLNKDFMILDPTLTKAEVRGEVCEAECIFHVMLIHRDVARPASWADMGDIKLAA